MRTVLTFMLGAALASGVAFFVMHKPAEPPVLATSGTPDERAVVEKPSPIASAEVSVEPERRSEPVAEPTRTVTPKKSTTMAKTLPPVTPTAPTPVPAVQQPALAQPEAPSPIVATIPPPVEERKPEPRVPHTVTIPAGSLVHVRLDEALSSERNQTGDTFRAVLDQPLVVDGLVIAEKGSLALGRISNLEQSGRVKGLAKLSVELTQINTSDGQKVKLQTETFSKQADNGKNSDAVKIGAAAAIGAAIGAIAGGGKGAAIGAGAGGAAGTGGVIATRGGAAQLPVETKLSFRLRDPITITERLR